MHSSWSYNLETPVYVGKITAPTGLFINGAFVDGSNNSTIDVLNPTTGEVITQVSEGTSKDVDIAVEAAETAFNTAWGLKVPGSVRGKLLAKLATLMEESTDELAAIEALNSGSTYTVMREWRVPMCIAFIRYYAGWADKISGQVIETDERKLTYTRHEPIGVVGQIIPWNSPLLMFAAKIAPALAAGNTVVMKPSEMTPLTALRVCTMVQEAGFPPGVLNVVVGYGNTVGAAMSSHMKIDMISFTGSTLTGRTIMEAAAKSNLKNVTMELGGKSPNIIFNDADLDQAVKWSTRGIFLNQGQMCFAGSRIYVQSGIYDEFLTKFTAQAMQRRIGDPFNPDSNQGPQISSHQTERIMGYIKSGIEDGATVHYGGYRHGGEGGNFITPTIFTNTTPGMKIVREEIFGPVSIVIKFDDQEDVIRQANDTTYGLAAAVFTQNISQAFEVGHALKAGTVWVNCYTELSPGIPFGGYKQSGIGREYGSYALEHYVNVKAMHVNIGHKLP
ncbi:aldehyde dehydrogenase [Rhodocollybia butyracea]|uniref:Aldehyde dehydrogenase n=1 Tax=Rhodocollybia butyracea TaxID=206335 RepID=A0A9P5PWQ9_9AGAR|nr:aldehyde dehydrogenase [Rhodocollybia butyracea]